MLHSPVLALKLKVKQSASEKQRLQHASRDRCEQAGWAVLGLLTVPWDPQVMGAGFGGAVMATQVALWDLQLLSP